MCNSIIVHRIFSFNIVLWYIIGNYHNTENALKTAIRNFLRTIQTSKLARHMNEQFQMHAKLGKKTRGKINRKY